MAGPAILAGPKVRKVYEHVGYLACLMKKTAQTCWAYNYVTLTSIQLIVLSSLLSQLHLLQLNLPEIQFSLSTPGLPPNLLQSRMAEQEAPFFPREKILERQKYFQSVQKHTYLKGPLDKVTSVAIPIALAATSLFLIGKGIYNMSHGIGKKE